MTQEKIRREFIAYLVEDKAARERACWFVKIGLVINTAMLLWLVLK